MISDHPTVSISGIIFLNEIDFHRIMSRTLNSSEASSQDIGEIVRILDSDMHGGLSHNEAGKRLLQYGENIISETRKTGILQVLLNELKEPMIFLLIVIAVLYSIFGNAADSLVIVVIVFLVVLIETINVNRARKSIEALKDMTTPTTFVIRDKVLSREKSVSLVPGDLVQLTAGERIPADGRLCQSFNLKIDESSLTGESFPVVKDSDSVPAGNILAELGNMVFSGTLVVQGTGRMLVTATGRNTELGKISGLVEEAEEIETPLDRTISQLTKVLAGLALAFSVIFPIIGYFQGQNFNDMLLTGLSMAFATVPEELPVLISITLAIGAFSLAKHKAVVKDLKAAETLGSVSVIATDKTGTITENKMAVSHLYYHGITSLQSDFSNQEFLKEMILSTGTIGINPDEPSSFRDPMEISILTYSLLKGTDLESLRASHKLKEEFSFDNRIKLSSFLYAESDGVFSLYVSGAPEVVLARSVNYLAEAGEVLELTSNQIEKIGETVEEISAKGERVIAIAVRNVKQLSEDRNSLEKELTFLGLVSFIDPERKEVSEAIRQCQNAGIKVIMLTGDHPKTAKTIATRVGITNSGRVISGQDLVKMDDTELSEALKEHSIFARITSEDKYRIVKILQQNGEVVAVTGDGVNDSPALQTAEIGIAMGIRGTDVAREASDMILMDDNFATIVEAVHEGREILYTLRKSLIYEISVKLALVMVLSVPLFLFIAFPFSPIQIIIMELLMDVGAMGGFLYEREEEGLMQLSSGRKSRNFIGRELMIFILAASVAIAIAVVGVYLYIYYTSGFLLRAQTAAFSVWMLSQIFLAHNLRTEKEPILVKGILSNKILVLWAVFTGLALFIITVFPDLQILLHTIYLTNTDWAIIVLASIASTFWMEAIKIWRYYSGRRRAKRA